MADRRVVVKDVRYLLAHVPGMVRHGSKPARELPKDASLAARLQGHLRRYEDATAYPPHQVFLGAHAPRDLWQLPRPWWQAPAPADSAPYLSCTSQGSVRGPFGELLAEAPFYGFLKIVDASNLVALAEEFVPEVRTALRRHPLVTSDDLERLGAGQPRARIEAQCAPGGAGGVGRGALPLVLGDGRMVGCVRHDHDEDASLAADVLLENLACKATAVLALRALLREGPVAAEGVGYLLGCGEEAVGDRYQRGGGNLAKAVGEMAGCVRATGADVKAFCCGPVHAIVLASGLVASGLFRDVVVVGGGSLAKLGMKVLGHLDHDVPVLEDVLAGVAILVGADDGHSPVLRLDSIGRHPVGAGAAQQAIFQELVAAPLARLGWRFDDVDTYATELQDPEITEPAGSGDVPLLNYRLIAALAILKGELRREEMPDFVAAHGLPGFSPTQGHIASAVPFLGHALVGLKEGTMQRAMFLAKGSLFLGRMTQMADGLSFILERNPSHRPS
jgi:glycine/sarcosine/betaine reductase complex component C subunit beta